MLTVEPEPADLLREGIASNPLFDEFVRFFVPPDARLSVQPEDLKAGLQPNGDERHASDWKRVNANTRAAIVSHLLAGGLDEPERIPNARLPNRHRVGEVNAVGVSLPDATPIAYLNLDLDGEYPPRSVLAWLKGWFGPDAVMVTSSSGRAGRYRVLARLARPLAHEDAHRMVADMANASGIPLKSGALELYPAKRNGRLPFGRGGCALFDATLTEAVRFPPFALFDRLRALPAVDLEAAHARTLAALTGVSTSVAQRLEQSASHVAAVNEQRVRAQVSRNLASMKRVQLWREGVSGPGQRDAAILALAQDCRRRGWPVSRAIAELRAWVQGGGLARSRAAREHPLEWLLTDTERRVRDIYKRPHIEPVARPLNLTAGETLKVIEIATNMPCSGIAHADTCAFLQCVLPHFKGAAVIAPLRAPNEPEGIRWSRARWMQFAGSSYSVIRDATGLFVCTETHRSADTFGPNAARSARWTCSFPFDLATPAPRRAIVPTRGRTPRRIYQGAIAFAANVARKSA